MPSLDQNMRRYITLGSLALLLVVTGVAIYFYFSSSTPSLSTTPLAGTSFPIAGTTDAPGSTTTGTPIEGGNASSEAVTARLVKISQGPVVPGAAIFAVKTVATTTTNLPTASSTATTTQRVKIATTTTSETFINYIEQISGNVFSYSLPSKKSVRINNKTIPGIQSAVWLPDGSTAYVRYLSGNSFETINTYILSAASSTGLFLPQNLSDIAVSTTSILTLASGVNGSVASLARTDGSRATALFSTPLTSLRVSYAGKGNYLAFTKPSGLLAGAVFIVSATGQFSRVAGPLNGLVAKASPSGKWVLVSYVNNGALRMELVEVATSTSIDLPVGTIADKCVWATDDTSIYCGVPENPQSGVTYPDDWYQGAVTLSDRIWRINVTSRFAQLVLDFSKEAGTSLDLIAPTIDSAATTLVFVNKNDGSLWSYSL